MPALQACCLRTPPRLLADRPRPHAANRPAPPTPMPAHVNRAAPELSVPRDYGSEQKRVAFLTALGSQLYGQTRIRLHLRRLPALLAAALPAAGG